VTSVSDDELMVQVRAGDARAFAVLYERHRARLFSYLVRLLRDHHLAEDLLQETFVRVFRGRGQYEASGHFLPWLFSIARRLVIDHYRRGRVRWDEEPGASESVAASDRTDHRAEAGELLARVDRALAQLPPAQREVILLSRVAGMDATEIARIIGSTPGAVRVALHRALRRLGALIGE
jgi:RNA polymerase sigma-70 factor (ECF subfamily)